MAVLPVLIVAGPTASGKSALAADVANHFGGVVINADSMQVYRELDVVTARPGAEETVRAPHRLYGVLSAAEPCSVARWLDMAAAEITGARASGRLPIVVGGTGLYLKALTEGLSPIPDIPETVREQARSLHAELGGAAFRERLRSLDPEAAGKLPAGDRQRLLRAWEVVTATGRTLSGWFRETPLKSPVDGPFRTILILPERTALYAACDRRFIRMIGNGAIAEVENLIRIGCGPDLPAMKAVGVRELASHIRGECDVDAAIAEGQKATRNYAKRQVTWLRHQIVPDCVLGAQYSESWREKIFNFIRHSVLTASI